jgi:membrane protease YdiL (CAAX protease family)
VLVEWSRALLSGALPEAQAVLLLGGGAALCLLAAGRSLAELGVGRDRLPLRILGGLALTAVLLLPAAVRWQGAPPAGGPLAIGLLGIAIGEEVAFRGALYAALERAAGPLAAVLGSSATFAVAHLLSHPLQFLPVIFAAGLVLAAWRWACRDVVGPVIAHSLADLSL